MRARSARQHHQITLRLCTHLASITQLPPHPQHPCSTPNLGRSKPTALVLYPSAPDILLATVSHPLANTSSRISAPKPLVLQPTKVPDRPTLLLRPYRGLRRQVVTGIRPRRVRHQQTLWPHPTLHHIHPDLRWLRTPSPVELPWAQTGQALPPTCRVRIMDCPESMPGLRMQAHLERMEHGQRSRPL